MYHKESLKSLIKISSLKFKAAFVLFLMLINVIPCFSQQSIKTREALAEKVYIQTDRQVYEKGETIWFKGIVAQAKDNLPSALSGVLHLELIDPFETIVAEKLIKLNEGIGQNFFSIEDFYTPGVYQLRAYTRWDQNFGVDFIFKTYLRITESDVPANLISKIETGTKNKTRFLFQPQLLDSTAGSEFELEMAYGDKIKKRTIRKNNSDNFLLEENFPKDIKSVHFKMRTATGKEWSETLSLTEPALDIQFLAEGGNFLGGMNNVLGFKVLDENGKGTSVSGTIYDDKDKIVTSFKSNELGMGRVYMFPDKSATYRIELAEEYSDIPFTYTFPSVSEKGSTLSLNQTKQNIVLLLKSTQFKSDSVYVEVSSRGIAIGEIGQKLKAGNQTLYFSKESLPAGILVFTLKDKEKNPIAERLFFNGAKTNTLNFEMLLSKNLYKIGEEVKLKLKFPRFSEDTSQVASASVLVTPKQLANEQSIWTYFMLASELRGRIEKPSFYFEGTDLKNPVELDNLLLTQGWRGYTFNTPLDGEKMNFLPEFALGIKGKVAALFDKDKMKDSVDVSLMVFGKEQTFYNQKTDSLGEFQFLLPPIEGRRVRAVLQTKNDKGKNRNYTLSLDEETKPKIQYEQSYALSGVKDSLRKILKKSNEKPKSDNYFEYDPNVNQLEEVFISDYKLTPQRQKVLDTYGKPDVVIDGKNIESSENEFSNGLYGVLRQSFGDKISFRLYQDSTGVRYQKAVVTGGMETMVLVDGIPVLSDAYQFLPNLPPSEVKSVEILDGITKNFAQLYRRVYPFRDQMATPIMGCILAIYTYSGNGLYTANKSKGILKTSIPVFAPTKQFYIPKYEPKEVSIDSEDNRITLYWDPDLRIKNKDSITIEYPNNDTPGKKRIIVEVISNEGKLWYKTLDYEVEED